MFTKYALNDVGRNKCNFCLAFCSVFVVVWAILVVNTITAMGPLAFLSLAQNQEGQIDAIISVGESAVYSRKDYGTYESKGSYLNYTEINQLYGDVDNYAPRKLFYNSRLYTNPPVDYETITLTLLMTEREKEIELGTAWPFPPLQKGECIIAKWLSENLLLDVGDKSKLNIYMPYTFNAIT